ncbi:hypothetical protein ACFL1H_08000, partial [Nanoarchaeota archaeon]
MKTIFLDDIKGEEREIIIPKSNAVDKLNDVYNEIDLDYIDWEKYLTIIKDELNNKIKPILNKIDYNNDDLKSFIYSKCNLYKDEYPVLGYFTGILLETLTERNKDNHFYINGHGQRFDYLFYFTKYVDKLIIENFQGDFIGNYIGFKGEVNLLIMNNIHGDDIAQGMCNNGTFNTMFVTNSGDNVFFTYTGLKCKGNIFAAINNKIGWVDNGNFENSYMN